MPDVPQHVALVVDGNRRWARAHNLPNANIGHERGVDVLRKVLARLRQRGVKTVTAWLFSTDNWNRSPDEVDHLMQLFRKFLAEEGDRFAKEKTRVRVLGDKSRFSKDLQLAMIDIEEKTKDFSDYYFNMALNYGGRAEILHAVKNIIRAGARPEDVDEELFSSYLYTAGQPDPDFIIRTSGEQRLSGFMPWQQEYSEFYFPSFHFPDFTDERVDEALQIYSDRERRHGK
jgi:undecaprenyl diphosphate synthase